MKAKFFPALMAVIASIAFLPLTRADDLCGAADAGCGAVEGCDDGNGCRNWDFGICDTSCGTGGYFGTAEVMFFQYYRSDGVRAGSFNVVPPATTDDVDFDPEASPRFTVGFVSDSGIGGRLRYWEYAHSGGPVFAASTVAMTVDTYNIDFELFERFCLNECWDVEISAGLRYNEFDETMLDPIPGPSVRLNAFTGWGGILGLEGVRKLGVLGNLYSRARIGILQDDHFVSNNAAGAAPVQDAILIDSTNTITEIAFGWEYTWETAGGSVLFGRAGYEWQHWTNFSSAFTPVTTTPPGNPVPDFAGQSDVGFGGFAFAIGVQR